MADTLENHGLSQSMQPNLVSKETDDYEIPDEIEEVIGNFLISPLYSFKYLFIPGKICGVQYELKAQPEFEL